MPRVLSRVESPDRRGSSTGASALPLVRVVWPVMVDLIRKHPSAEAGAVHLRAAGFMFTLCVLLVLLAASPKRVALWRCAAGENRPAAVAETHWSATWHPIDEPAGKAVSPVPAPVALQQEGDVVARLIRTGAAYLRSRRLRFGGWSILSDASRARQDPAHEAQVVSAGAIVDELAMTSLACSSIAKALAEPTAESPREWAWLGSSMRRSVEDRSSKVRGVPAYVASPWSLAAAIDAVCALMPMEDARVSQEMLQPLVDALLERQHEGTLDVAACRAAVEGCERPGKLVMPAVVALEAPAVVTLFSADAKRRGRLRTGLPVSLVGGTPAAWGAMWKALQGGADGSTADFVVEWADEGDSRTPWTRDGGWDYAHSNASHVALTAYALLALRKAKDVGADIPPDRVVAACNFLEAMRHLELADSNGLHGGSRYVNRIDERMPQAMRSVGACASELALYAWGRGDKQRMEHALALYEQEGWRTHERWGEWILHDESEGRNPPYFGLFGCWMALRCARLLDARGSDIRAALVRLLQHRQRDDGSWLDSPATGPQVGTALALAALSEARVQTGTKPLDGLR